MVGDEAPGRPRTRAGGFAALLLACAFPAGAADPLPAWIGTGNAAAGERLFTGATRFANGGPPCASCHDVAGLPFPGGGTLGPDLTATWTKYGPEAMEPVLSTLYFPTMAALFAVRPMTDAEKGDLTAFFRGTAGRGSTRWTTTAELAALAAAGTVVFLLAAALAWRGRIRSVRRGFFGRSLRKEAARR